MEILDFSVDALVFPERAGDGVIHTGGLTREEREAVERLVDITQLPQLSVHFYQLPLQLSYRQRNLLQIV